MKEVVIAALIVAVPVAARQFIKSYKARKSIADAVVDAIEAGLEATDKK
jgi:hypothetical protein